MCKQSISRLDHAPSMAGKQLFFEDWTAGKRATKTANQWGETNPKRFLDHTLAIPVPELFSCRLYAAA